MKMVMLLMMFFFSFFLTRELNSHYALHQNVCISEYQYKVQHIEICNGMQIHVAINKVSVDLRVVCTYSREGYVTLLYLDAVTSRSNHLSFLRYVAAKKERHQKIAPLSTTLLYV